ncbi:Myb/SANT-like DNA-binding domain 4 [Dillenia turbinata]|uniref:Myb/SANT-like DNA-binding domain 4 n=1 Tax=Dillenia turbinata TaxID=194707 RepID=A0AAN8ZSH9_9MAGN
MDGGGMSGGLYSGLGSGLLGLEMPLHQPQPQPQQQNPQNPHHLQQQQSHTHIVNFAHPDSDHQLPQSMKQNCPYVAKPKNQQQLALSDEDEPTDSTGDGKRKMSPWQRMKWTDSMVRLLIMAVYYIGDECGSEGNDPSGKKKGGGLLQKKGKWKSVSRAMMEKGFYVSPQQCEDKFNDLNKRYKRVNDILGKGTACKVVENQSLLDNMDHLSAKRKEEVRKLLNSKHLFFREMCAYHNSCGGGGGGSGAHHSPDTVVEPSHHQLQQQQQQQRCSHSAESAPIVHNSSRVETEGSKLGKAGSGEEEDEDDDDDEEEDDDEGEDEEVGEGGARHEEEEDENDERPSRKRQRMGSFLPISPLMQQFTSELTSVLQDVGKSPWEKRQWMQTRLIQLEEQKMSYHCQAFELEKQRLKWVKFSSKKEREMERKKLDNERTRLNNDRMVLLLRQKEFELLDFQQPPQSNKRPDPSSITG